MEQSKLIKKLNEYRKQYDIFRRSIDEKSDNFETIMYDGPPFASGTPHFGHGLVSAMKDTMGRYKAMKGYKIIRNWGWDCHGLPVEKAVEKKLGIDGKKDIEEKIGIEKFSEECRKYVSNVSGEWTDFVDTIGRRADMHNAYKTMDLSFMESVMNVFSHLYNKNLVYKGFKVQRHCPSCATGLANNEVNEGYEDRQDQAITIKFQLKNTPNTVYEHCEDGAIQVVCCRIHQDNKTLISYHKKGQKYVFPGGKVEKGDSINKTVEKEIQEELGVNVVKQKIIGQCKEILKGDIWNLIYVDVEIEGTPTNKEPEKATHVVRAETIKYDNTLGFALKIENTIIDDEQEIINQFYDIYVYEKKIMQTEQSDKNVYALAWTTTPWTLPANGFLATGKDIKYAMIFDHNNQEYYVLAEQLVKKYYKQDTEYQIVKTFRGEELKGISYIPLFDYIYQSKISQNYKDIYFQIMNADFVSTEDGTGIVHVAPSFGQEDFEAVATELLPRDKSRERLFLPVNDYGEYNELIPNRKGINVFEGNKEIIKTLKENKQLILQQSYNHSYPHCWRCHTPLISKAMDSWFIKEPSLKPQTLEQGEKIHFVPQSIKKRFLDTLDSAPDRNLSRNRYRGSPIPIWENENNPEQRVITESLEDLYQKTRTGSQNLTKNIFVRHGRTDFNELKQYDGSGASVLTEEGKQQAQEVKQKLHYLKDEKELVIIISPLQRTWQTIQPTLEALFPESDRDTLEKKYYEIHEKYLPLFKDRSLKEMMLGENEKNIYPLDEEKNIYIDFRLTDHYSPDVNGKYSPCDSLNWTKPDETLSKEGETLNENFKRVGNLIHYWNTEHKSKTLLFVSHNDTIGLARKYIRDRAGNYAQNRKRYLSKNGQVSIHYRDNNKQAELDLHRPYVDTYWFKIDGNIYKRIPEVMDCWFESGSMPFGQAGYVKTQNGEKYSNKPLIYPADFIIEGLDQTRGWFRVMHVIGNAITGQNSYNNVVINGLILAEDGKKMSKSLQNYPDPNYLFGKYGTDAYRLYVLGSPAVRAEPMKFSEKGVDQVYKDFTVSLNNAYNFFSTYAKVDNFKYEEKNIYFIKTAENENEEMFTNQDFIENIVRLDVDMIHTTTKQAIATAKKLQDIVHAYSNKKVEIITDELFKSTEIQDKEYANHIEKLNANKDKNILLVGENKDFDKLWTIQYGEQPHNPIQTLEINKIPNQKITNNLDKWILAEFNKLIIAFEKAMNAYSLDTGAKTLTDFIEKLTNRYIRRSRRRFRASGMEQDKKTAYHTLFTILQKFTKIAASFAPFITEDIYLKLQSFTTHGKKEGDSVHLQLLPVISKQYINQTLLTEIATVRKIISLGLFVRAKNNIKVKQPLQNIKIKL